MPHPSTHTTTHATNDTSAAATSAESQPDNELLWKFSHQTHRLDENGKGPKNTRFIAFTRPDEVSDWGEPKSASELSEALKTMVGAEDLDEEKTEALNTALQFDLTKAMLGTEKWASLGVGEVLACHMTSSELKERLQVLYRNAEGGKAAVTSRV